MGGLMMVIGLIVSVLAGWATLHLSGSGIADASGAAASICSAVC